MNRFGNVSPFVSDAPPHSLRQYDAIARPDQQVLQQFDDGIEAICFAAVGATAPYCLSRGSLVPGRFGTTIHVRALDLGRPHAKAIIAGAVLGLAVLDVADRVGRRQIP